METNIELDDLQMMKQQVALLKKKIDEEKLEHARLLQLHDLIHKQLRTVNQDRNWMICMMILGCASMFFLYGDNQAFFISDRVYLSFSFYYLVFVVDFFKFRII